jgi:hypothetical protein
MFLRQCPTVHGGIGCCQKKIKLVSQCQWPITLSRTSHVCQGGNEMIPEPVDRGT